MDLLVVDLAPEETVEQLQSLHSILNAHFGDLRDARARLDPQAPVFALEHDLSHAKLDLLKEAVRAAISRNSLVHYRTSWLPFVVYAAEMGYGYVGNEYWTTFSSLTPRWTNQERSTVRDWFVLFRDRFGGASPTGAWANHFTIISWPITHAVLPIYLQRNLAQLLFEFSGALTSQLLDDSELLGLRLARRATNYTERFRIFCENTSLVGQVAAALLSGENEPTPYLTAPTLARIVDGLSDEQQARHWLKSARVSARRVRGFRSFACTDRVATMPKKSSRATDPRLFLRRDVGWRAYAELPDLTTLAADLPMVYDDLRLSRASVNGGIRSVPPSGLLYPGQEMRFARWPRPDRPFLQLEQGTAESNRILSSQCAITPGPWLFRRQGAGLAIEVRGKFVRPGHQYVLVSADSLGAPDIPWFAQTTLNAQGVKAYEFVVPPQLNESETSALALAGLGLVSHVAIRPVGIVASAWDGEGDAEWLAGEPAILGIRSDVAPRRARVTVDGSAYFLGWTPGDSELLFSLDGLAVGGHEMEVALLGHEDRELASGSLTVTVRDPQVRPEGASVGEGIRLLATPARPSLAELWNGRAGTSNATALVTREASQLFDILEAGSSDTEDSPLPDALYHPLLVRALLAHASSWAGWDTTLRRELGLNSKDARRRLTALLGYGRLDTHRLGTAATNRAVVVAGGHIARNERHTYELPLPPSLRARAEWHRFTITLAYAVPTVGQLSRYRGAKVYFATPDTNLAGGDRTDAEYNTVRRGSLQHEIVEGTRTMVFGDGDAFPIHVECMDDAQRLGSGKNIRYALVVSVETAERTSTTVHDEVRARLRERVRDRASGRVQT